MASISPKTRQILAMAHVGVHELDARSLEASQVQLRAPPVKVVAGDQLPIGMTLGKREQRASSR